MSKPRPFNPRMKLRTVTRVLDDTFQITRLAHAHGRPEIIAECDHAFGVIRAAERILVHQMALLDLRCNLSWEETKFLHGLLL